MIARLIPIFSRTSSCMTSVLSGKHDVPLCLRASRKRIVPVRVYTRALYVTIRALIKLVWVFRSGRRIMVIPWAVHRYDGLYFWKAVTNFGELRYGEVRRIPLPRPRVN